MLLDSYLLHSKTTLLNKYNSIYIIQFYLIIYAYKYIYKRKNTITIIILSYEYYFECIYVNKTLIKSID